MIKITALGTAVPDFEHTQDQILPFMQNIYAADSNEARKIRFLYHQSGIQKRYSVLKDYSCPKEEWTFYSQDLDTAFPSLEKRMRCYKNEALKLAVKAIENLGLTKAREATHVISVSCTGMSAPGLDLEIITALQLSNDTERSSINFMGCYAAIHGMKQATAICKATPNAKVLVVCVELCTLHFQKEATGDNIMSSMLFADGAAAILIENNESNDGLTIESFYASILPKGEKDMAWELSSTGFQMTLTGYIPDLLAADFKPLIERALHKSNRSIEEVDYWCIHPGGKKILDVIKENLGIESSKIENSYGVLNDYGNMSSPTVLFVLKRIWENHLNAAHNPATIVGAAFGPGLTMETFTLSYA
ncbi:MAG: type III polyketide synthase [Chitinophagaceae bacterium]|nr:type III polyketide synthase [Chitinophagaceae bacterium]